VDKKLLTGYLNKEEKSFDPFGGAKRSIEVAPKSSPFKAEQRSAAQSLP